LQEQNTAIGALKVRVLFSLAEMEMSLSDINAIAPGMLLSIDGKGNETVSILVNGKPVAAGELVKVGEGLAVRVVRLASDA
jgi:type III secretion protein Q